MNQFDSVLCAEVTQQIHRAPLVLLPGGRVVIQGGTVKRVATLAAVYLPVFAELLDSLFFRRGVKDSVRIVVIPALEVAQAKLPLLVFHVTCPLAGFLLFDYESHVIPPRIGSLIHFSIESLQSQQSTVNSLQFEVDPRGSLYVDAVMLSPLAAPRVNSAKHLGGSQMARCGKDNCGDSSPAKQRRAQNDRERLRIGASINDLITQ